MLYVPDRMLPCSLFMLVFMLTSRRDVSFYQCTFCNPWSLEYLFVHYFRSALSHNYRQRKGDHTSTYRTWYCLLVSFSGGAPSDGARAADRKSPPAAAGWHSRRGCAVVRFGCVFGLSCADSNITCSHWRRPLYLSLAWWQLYLSRAS